MRRDNERQQNFRQVRSDKPDNAANVPNKYLGMSPKDFAAYYNSAVAKLGKDNLQIVKTEVNGKECVYTLKGSNCGMGGMVQDGELVGVAIRSPKNSTDFPMIVTILIAVMDSVKNVDGKSVMEQIGQGRTVVENNGVKFVASAGDSEIIFLVTSANYNPK